MEYHKLKILGGPTIIFEKRRQPIATIMSTTKFGYGFETVREKGIAHLIEHVVFKGTKTRSQKEISSTIEKVGGILNGFTDEEETAFWTKIPSKHFSLGFEIISDLSNNPLFNKKHIEQEKKVVIEESKMYHDTPQRFVLDKIKEMLYEKPFGLDGIGTEKTLSKMNKQSLLKVWNKYHISSNKIIVIVGKTNFSVIKDLVKKYYPQNKKEIRLNLNPIKRSGNFIEKRKNIDQAHIALGFHIPKLADKKRYVSEIFNAILCEGMSSRLFQEIREKRNLAYAVKSFLERGKNYGYFIIYVGTLKEKVKKVLEIIKKEIKKMKNVTNSEIEQAKEQLIGNHLLLRESSEETARDLLYNEIAKNASEHYNYEKNIIKVKINEIRKFRIRNFSSAIVIPE